MKNSTQYLILGIVCVVLIVGYFLVRAYAASKEKSVTSEIFGSIIGLGSKLGSKLFPDDDEVEVLDYDPATNSWN